jgi:hypothetical protein
VRELERLDRGIGALGVEVGAVQPWKKFQRAFSTPSRSITTMLPFLRSILPLVTSAYQS